MGLWNKLFGKKKKRPVVSRYSAALGRLAKRRGVPIYSLDLYDDNLLVDLLLLGLILSNDGESYVDDPTWVDTTGEFTETESVADVTETAVEVTPTILKEVEEVVDTPVVVTPEPTVVETERSVSLPSPPPPVEPSTDRSWTGESSGSSWSSGGSDFGGSSDSGGGDSGGGSDD